MSRMQVSTRSQAEDTVEALYHSMERRISASPPGLCPVDMAHNFLTLCMAQTCGKCVPCRVGLKQLSNLITEVLDGEPDASVLDLIEETAQVIVDSADCAVGVKAAEMILTGIKGFRDDYLEHINHHRCLSKMYTPVPCVHHCPANVDIPGYVALVNKGRYDDAVRLIRKDNPLPLACAYICEHPCEAICRRSMVDNPINIRGIKRVAVEKAGKVPHPTPLAATGKKVAVVGGGPGGLSCAYYLALMGHSVTIYEKRDKLGGMMRYGIPSYRLPRNLMDEEIASILGVGIEAKTGVDVGTDISFQDLSKEYDSVYISIGAHTDRKVGIEGEDAEGVMSAVELLRGIGDDVLPDFTGKNVVVIGGGNVAMDVTRSAIRLGAKQVICTYRRRKEDMTAQVEEVEGAMAEGAELMTMVAPDHIEKDSNGHVAALWVRPQIVGLADAGGRPAPVDADKDPEKIPADIVIVAIGQGISAKGLEETGIEIQRGGRLPANHDTRIPDKEGFFAGGDCVTGPATVIKAIAAGKVAAANIDEYLGFNHVLEYDIEIPVPRFSSMQATGRVNISEKPAYQRRTNFECIENCMSDEEAFLESGRCLRCDHFGYGIFKGGRVTKW